MEHYRYRFHGHAVKKKKKLITFIETTKRIPYLVKGKPIILHRNEFNLMWETHVFQSQNPTVAPSSDQEG